MHVRGRVAALLELGSGFNPEFTGRENVLLNGSILGFSAKEMAAKFAAIVSFADIGEFIDQPVKIYSSGMMVRLAFAVQTAVEPDILIVDEALSVGDFFFQQKCFRRIAELRERGTTILFVSHDTASVRDLCSRALLLQQGRARFFGDTQLAISHYYQEQAGQPSQSPAALADENAATANSGSAEKFFSNAIWVQNRDDQATPEADAFIAGLAILGTDGSATTSVKLGGTAMVSVLIKARVHTAVTAAIELKNRHDQVVCSLSTAGTGLNPVELQPGQLVRVDFEVVFNLEAGLYTLCGIAGKAGPKPNRGFRLAATPWVGPLKITWDYETETAPFLGMFGPPVVVRTKVSQ